MEIVPGKSFGGFILGMNSQDACNFILKSKHLSHVELKYNEKDPLAFDLIVDLIEDGYLLRFDSTTQILKVVEVYDIPKVKLLYSGSVFSTTSDRAPTLVNIYEKFGPTRPGEYDPMSGHYYLHYPGLTFSFAIPKKFESLFDNLNGIPPMEFPDRTTPLASRIIIYYGSNPKLPEMPPILSLSKDKPYFEEIMVQLSKGITFTNRKFSLDFQSSTEDVLTLLGPPSKVFYKEEDKMKIHTSSYSGLGCCDYFYNYFNLGIDLLFDSQTHLIKKFILHTNFPSHHEFNQYVKCNFKLIVQNKSKKKENAQQQIITSDSRWNTVQEILGDAGKPIVHNRGSNLNPFGPTLFYGYNDGLILEVMHNNYIATIQLWKPTTTTK